MFQEREAQLKIICEERVIPFPAKIVTLGVALPILAFPLASQHYLLTPWMPFFMKYLQSVQVLGAGMHWGSAISRHECQPHAITSNL